MTGSRLRWERGDDGSLSAIVLPVRLDDDAAAPRGVIVRFGGPVGFLSARRGRDGRLRAASPWGCVRRQIARLVAAEEAAR